MKPDQLADNHPTEIADMKKAAPWNSPRRWIWIVVFLAITVLVSSRFTDARNLALALSQGIWQWVVLGVAIHIAYFCLYAFLYQAGFKTVGVQARAWGLIPMVAGAIFVNAVAPIGGVGGGALFVNYAARQGQSGARAAVGLIVVLLADLVTLIPLIIFGLLYLRHRQVLAFYDTLAGALFVLFVLMLTGMIAVAGWRRIYVERALTWLKKAVNWSGARFERVDLLGSDWVERTAHELAGAAKTIIHHPRELGTTVIWGFVVHLVNLVGLYAFFLAFRQPVELGTLVASFSLGIVFYVIAIIPQGVGAVEGIMSLILTSLGISSTKAITIVLAFRGVNFWMPLAVGLLVVPRISRQLSVE